MKDKILVRHEGFVNREQREKLMGHKSVSVWFTGLSGSGKSSIAHNLEAVLVENGKHSFVLDGDNVRLGVNKDLDFSPEGRVENIRRVGEVSRLFADAGFIVLSAFISPYKKDRRMVRELFEPGRFIEVYIKCPLSVCESRDVKGLYKLAREGKISEFTGVSAPYEEPENPELVLDTNEKSVEECMDVVYRYLQHQGIIK